MLNREIIKIAITSHYLLVVAAIIYFSQTQIGETTLSKFGVLILLAGVSLIGWANHYAGSVYKFAPELQKNAYIITGGPYDYIRHPRYAGIMISLLGFAIACESNVGIAIWALIVAPFHVIRAKNEEKTLQQKYGEKYFEWIQRVGFMTPKIRYPFKPSYATENNKTRKKRGK